jgi:SAM-dependent methyltransferase
VNSPALISTDLFDVLACPACRGGLTTDRVRRALRCTACGARYSTHLEIPILLPPALQPADRLSSHKHQQVAFFDQDPRDDFGITRPRGAPELHAWLLREKFRRSIFGLEELLPSSSVLTICGGSGLDAELLAEKGARVILSDISLGVVLQARERARRFGLDIELVVADAEALPFRDSSIDIVYVHDGLHHLEQPRLGLAEMARVARSAVSITEPAAARATAAAVRLGWAEAREEAGNPVRRILLDEIVSDLKLRGFQPIRPHRYVMYYRHWPGRAVRILSKSLFLPLAKAGFVLFNHLLGRYGNKLAVQAVRHSGERERRSNAYTS